MRPDLEKSLIHVSENKYKVKTNGHYRYFYLVECCCCGKKMYQCSTSQGRGSKPQCGCGVPSGRFAFVCSYCGKHFRGYKHKTTSKKYCSHVCYLESVIGENNPNWKGGAMYAVPIDETVRSLINNCISRRARNSRKMNELVGYSPLKLMKHMERRFKDGMSWENRSMWHIDHIIPRSAFNYKTQKDTDFRRCWSLKNLQPLWSNENLKKHAKITKPFQPSLF